jgi:hypothetical protein
MRLMMAEEVTLSYPKPEQRYTAAGALQVSLPTGEITHRRCDSGSGDGELAYPRRHEAHMGRLSSSSEIGHLDDCV